MNLDDLDQDARQRIGKPLADCTPDDYRQLVAMNMTESAYLRASVDQARAALTEASQCGCDRFEVPINPDGSPDLAHSRVHHTCGL